MISLPTGIFFHYQQGERLRDFPQALEGILEKENAFLYDAFYPSKPESSFDLDPFPEELLLKVHSPEMIRSVKSTGEYLGALYSAAGTVSAAVKILSGEIRNAFVFTGFGDHHAGSHFFGGGCYFNGAALAVQELRDRFQARRFAVVDTDPHHGNGTWEIFENDPDVLYLCFCSGPFQERNGNVNIPVPWRIDDDRYLRLVTESGKRWVKGFGPEMIFWNWGYDGTMGEYGDIGLSPDLHVRLAGEIQGLADEVCKGSLVTVLCGGGRRDLATYLIPKVIAVLMGEKVGGMTPWPVPTEGAFPWN